MAYQVSPGVNISEIDLTTVVPGIATSTGAIAGVFRWGPVQERVLISNETNLVNTFGKPTTFNQETFFTAANFLGYGNALYVVRAANTTSTNSSIGALNAVANVGAANVVTCVVKNTTDYLTKASFDANALYVAKYPGSLGSSIKVSVCDSATAFSSNLNLLIANSTNQTNGSFAISVGSNTGRMIFTSNAAVTNALADAITVNNSIVVGDLLKVGNASIGAQYLMISAASSTGSNASAAWINLSFTDTYRLSTDYVANTTTNISNSVITASISNTTMTVTSGAVFPGLVLTNTASNGTTVISGSGNTWTVSISQNVASSNIATLAVTQARNWEFFNSVDKAPGTSAYVAEFGNTSAIDTLHAVVQDKNGRFTGVAGTILEVFKDMSRANDAKSSIGASTYYKNVINEGSRYIWWANDRSGAATANATNVVTSTASTPLSLAFAGGTDGYSESTIDVGTLATGYDLFNAAENVDVSLILQGKPTGGSATVGGQTVSNFQLANYIIDNITEVRKDCVVFITPDDAIVRSVPGQESTSIVNWAGALHSSTYAVVDSGYKYFYDRYNDQYIYVPTNADVAGLCARTEQTNDAWWSPAGFNRGQIKNLIKLRFNPTKTDRDLLYKNSVNPIVTFPGQGTVLFGDKTFTLKPSAFDRINVRRLFIVLERAISQASKFSLFEFNDGFTRAQFSSLVNPYLRDVQARRGITDFLVVCDETNNTPDRIDRNEFWGDIYIKPNRSINFIQLNFVAVRTGVSFSTVVGQF